MNSEDPTQTLRDQSEDTVTNTVQLTLSKEHTREFFENLFGHPESIRLTLPGEFLIEKNEIVNLHYLLAQRMNEQNKTDIVMFHAVVDYDDDTSIEFNHFENFVSYNEIKAVSPKALRLAWTFLIQFEGKQAPQKQTIRIGFLTQGAWGGPRRATLDDTGVAFLLSQPTDYIAAKIEHTARTWGSDLESLLSKHLKVFIRPEDPSHAFLRKQSGWIGLLTFLLMLACGLSGIYLSNQNVHLAQQEVYEKTMQLGSSPANIESKLNYVMALNFRNLSSARAAMNTALTIAFFIVSIISGFIIAAYTQEYARPKSSYILLTSVAQRAKAEEDRTDTKQLLKLIASYTIAAIIALLKLFVLPLVWK